MIFDPAELDERTQRALTKHFAAGRGDRVPVAVQDIADLASVVVVIGTGGGEEAARVVANAAAVTLQAAYPRANTLDLRQVDIHKWAESGPANPASLALGKTMVCDRLLGAQIPDSYGIRGMEVTDQVDVLAGCLVTAMIAGAVLRGETPAR